jgi:methylase of polypeptide subunit release factors
MDKQQARDLIKKTFEQPFDKTRFTAFIKNLLNRIEEDLIPQRQGKYIPEAYRQYISTFERIGKFNDGENRIDILIIKLQKETSLASARTMQRNFVAGYLQGKYGSSNEKEAALVAYVAPDETDWRFSLVKMDYKFEQAPTGKMKVEEEFTPARRWSFLVGENEKSHTAQSRLVNILANDEHNPTLTELEEAFNIESVTKEFFLKYRDLFIRTKEALDEVVQNNPNIKADFEAKGVNTVDFAKKLLGQIVFLYFLQKKGWFGVGRDAKWGTGSKIFLRELFEKKHSGYNNFFNDILEPLFYEALRIGEERKQDDYYYSRFNCKVPFLNGGLFDPIGNYDWVHTDIQLPDSLFSNKSKTKEGDEGNGILDVFDRYNFTVREDELLEKEVAIDPELLGKAYEKFNAIRPDNFEEYQIALKSGKKGNESKFNKQYGVYYTPREIVHYMCQQSLINYLFTELNSDKISYEKLGDPNLEMFGNKGKKGQLDITIEHREKPLISKEDIEKFVHLGEQVSENEAIALIKEQRINTGIQKSTEKKLQLPESIRTNAELIDQKLADITVCDPAVGSGAFPMGMMSEIVKARNVLTTFIHPPESPLDKVRIKGGSRTPYDFKHQCIEHSLYGVDIDPGAVEIAKLRLWLSLVVDEEDIKNIKPLPNLDYKIVCGNSLLGVQRTLDNWKDFAGLEKLKPPYFNETNPTKKQEYKRQIDQLISQITNGHKEFDFEVYFSEVFHDEKKGFNVVITNPPYVGEKGHKEIFGKVKQGLLSKFYLGKMDYFYFFFHLSLNIAKSNSSIAFITTNYYSTAMGAKKLRQDFKERAIIKNLKNFNELKIFESALGQHNMITILEKAQDENAVAQTCITQRQGMATSETLQQILNGRDTETHYYKVSQKDIYDGDEYYIRLGGQNSYKNTNPLQTILAKIKNQGQCLGALCNVNNGVFAGADRLNENKKNRYKINDAQVNEGIFVLTNDEVKNLRLSKNEKGLIKPLFKNSDIKNYYTNTKNELNLINLRYTDRPNLEDYPNIKNHLIRFKKLLADRPQTGTLESAFNNGYWYVMSTSRRVDMEGSKIMAPQRSSRNTFGYNEIPWYASADVYFITEKYKSVLLKYILALLNSKLTFLWLYYRGKRKGETLELYQKPLSEIPIKKVNLDDQRPFIEIVDKILCITNSVNYLTNLSEQAEVKEYEKQIDQMVYQLYGLTEDEIKVAEGNIK